MQSLRSSVVASFVAALGMQRAGYDGPLRGPLASFFTGLRSGTLGVASRMSAPAGARAGVFLARPQQCTANSRRALQRPCAPHHLVFPHPHSPNHIALRLAGSVWAHGAIAATLHNVPFCARRPSPPGPCRGIPAWQPQAPVRSPQNTHYAKWPPALRAAKVCLRHVAYGRFVGVPAVARGLVGRAS